MTAAPSGRCGPVGSIGLVFRGACGWALCALLVACGGALHFEVPITSPARLPLVTYPVIVLAGGHLEMESRILDALEQHLRSDPGVTVLRVDMAELEPMRRASEFPTGSLTLLVELELEVDSRATWRSRPVEVCGPVGCQLREQTVVSPQARYAGVLALSVHEGPSARLLQRESLRGVYVEDDSLDGPRVLIDQLLKRALGLLARGEALVAIELLPVQHKSVDKLLVRVREGEAVKVLPALERIASSSGALALPSAQRARLLFDLAMVQWIVLQETGCGVEAGGQGCSEEALSSGYGRVEHLLREAGQLKARSLYRRWSDWVQEDFPRRLDLERQRRARRHNFAWTQAAGGVADPSGAAGAEQVPAGPAEDISAVGEPSGLAAPQPR